MKLSIFGTIVSLIALAFFSVIIFKATGSYFLSAVFGVVITAYACRPCVDGGKFLWEKK